MGKEFRAHGLTNFTIQFGYPDKSGGLTKSLILDLTNVRVAADPCKTFILGTDVMMGTQGSDVVLPWHILLSGQIRIPLRRQDLPWQVTVHLDVPPGARYKPEWDQKPWKPKPGAQGRKGK